MADPPDAGDEAARLIRDFLAGLPADPAALMEAFRERELVEEATLAALGVYPVCVVHGDMESADDEKRIYGPDGLHARAARAGQYHQTQGGNAGTIWFFAGPDAERAASTFRRAAEAIARRWWIITETSYPVYDR